MIKKMNFGMVILMVFTLFSGTLSATEKAEIQQENLLQQEITDAELQKFATAFLGMRSIDENARLEMGQMIKDQGMEIERFNEIYQAKMNPSAELDLSEQVEQKYQEISEQIQKMQDEYAQEKETTISEAGITVERFQQIATQVQNDENLQQRLIAVLQEMNPE